MADHVVDVVVARGHDQVPAIGPEECSVQAPTYALDPRDRHLRPVQIDDPGTASLFERDDEFVHEGVAMMMPGSESTVFTCGSKPRNSTRFRGSQLAASRITAVFGTCDPAARYRPSLDPASDAPFDPAQTLRTSFRERRSILWM